MTAPRVTQSKIEAAIKAIIAADPSRVVVADVRRGIVESRPAGDSRARDDEPEPWD